MEDSHCHFISLSTVHVYFVLEPWSRQSCDRNGMILAGAVAYRDKASPAALAFEHQFRVPLLLYPSNSLLIALKQQQKMDHDLGSMHPHGRPGKSSWLWLQFGTALTIVVIWAVHWQMVISPSSPFFSILTLNK